MDWLGQVQRSRLWGVLRQLEARELVSRARDRARVFRFSGHPSVAARLPRDAVTVGRADALGLVGDVDHFDGYVASAELDGLVSHHGLIRDARGQYSLRATGFDLVAVAGIADAGSALAAIDAAAALDARGRGVGLDLLQQVLEGFRG